MTPSLSVVVISWNQLAALRCLVEQLLSQDLDRHAYEVIIVDDASTDGTRAWLGSLDDNCVQALCGERNSGRAVSRNRGILAAKGEVIVMVDGDHTVQQDFLSVHASRHLKEKCVIVGKSVFVDHPDFRALNHYLNHGGATKLPEDHPLPGRYFLTRNCSVPRELLLQVGLFDERFSEWGGEDLDLGVRLEATGIPIYGEPKALAVHHHLRPLNDLLRNLYVYGRESVPILVEQHPQLFMELNLDRSLPLPSGAPRYSVLYRALFRCLFAPPIYSIIRMIGNVFRRYRLPRFIFDYLHLRQYSMGYMHYLHLRKEGVPSGRNH